MPALRCSSFGAGTFGTVRNRLHGSVACDEVGISMRHAPDRRQVRRARRMFHVLAKLEGYALSNWRNTRPAGAERIVAWRKAVAEVDASSDKLPTMTEP
jgi:hypothetical protein